MWNQEIISFWNNTQNQLSIFRTKNLDEINDDSRGMYNTNSPIKLKTTMFKASSCDYSDVYILHTGTISGKRK